MEKQRCLPPMLRKLYRFQPIVVPGDDRLSQLKRGEIWFSDPAKFNDPFDLKPHITDLVPGRWCDDAAFKFAMRNALASLLASPAMYQGALFIDPTLNGEFQAWTGEDAEDELNWDNRLQAAIETRITQFGVVCLTPQWDSRLMWAHYADSGQGFCIEYEVDWGQQAPNIRYVPVQYVSEVPELCFTEAMFTPHQFLQRVLASKHSDWAYEKEVRLVSLTGKGQSLTVDPSFVRVTGLIAGHAMPEPLLIHLKETATRLGIGAWRMKIGTLGGLSREPCA
jgi:hypothetical protein